MGQEIAPKKWNYDWTKHPDNQIWNAWANRRFAMMRECLTQGNAFQIVSGGKSLEPLVLSNEVCVFAPIDPKGNGLTIGPGDIVFYSIQPGWRYYGHKVWQKVTDGGNFEYFIIGNNKKGKAAWSNGWCSRYMIYGLLVATERGEYKRQTIATT